MLCVTNEQRDRQIGESVGRTANRLVPVSGTQFPPLQIACFGPSLRDTWKEIRPGCPIMTCSGAHKFLRSHNTIPNYQVEADPRQHKVDLIGNPNKLTVYLIASQCHPKLWDHLQDFNPILWHAYDPTGNPAIPKGEWAYRGGSNVGTHTPAIASALGFTDLHFYGMDACFAKDGASHAGDHPSKDPIEEMVYEGVTYQTTANLLKTAFEMLYLLDSMPHLKATFHGKGLMQEMAKRHVAKPSPQPFAIQIT